MQRRFRGRAVEAAGYVQRRREDMKQRKGEGCTERQKGKRRHDGHDGGGEADTMPGQAGLIVRGGSGLWMVDVERGPNTSMVAWLVRLLEVNSQVVK
ncbi:hypothetical protein HBI56_230310 [Parastagonospora nodorum]|uniref:Uncharacterized protein n=1 Tax=Phaeosphaeria nodorum (strain SN15 / ATCC MYA-4574 / FGSC 10173) TaxID=321614 RepID=A0A7U2I774_PHANO|nr:hypothetical protein HBH56_223240 [Parastagonospora nodorum]QRD04384.1 hypothetical protein JI435_421050 [Parastagonospora nodorum SN15]KAH3921912.1 hypothetical protein HBH54_231390 [Parastagonospora nodorum]KAH3939455.1 hypothetical protein HBH53_235400 [Parastagonospora nodorum]KAH3957227.1 hypothetical protein HBH51_228770 [Parastagonospora nodorum]